MLRLLAPVLLAVLAVPAWADDRRADADRLARVVAPFVHSRTVAVVHVDLARIDFDGVVRWLKEHNLKEPDRLEQVRKAIGLVESIHALGAQDVFVLLDLDLELDGPPPLVITLAPNIRPPGAAIVLRALLRVVSDLQVEPREDCLLVGGARALKRLRRVKPVEHPELARVLAERQEGAHHALVLLPDDLRRALEETMPRLPSPVGGGSIQLLTQEVRWLAIALDLPPRPRLTAVLQAADAKAAEKLAGLADRAIRFGEQAAHLKEQEPRGKLPLLLQPKVEDTHLRWSLRREDCTDVLLALGRPLLEEVGGQQTINDFKQIALAMHNYMSVYNTFPPAYSTSKDGKPLLSWRVHILPYLEQEHLYKEFHLDEPWDSEHNRKLIARMPKVFADPTRPELARQGKTTFLVPVGKDTIFPGTRGVAIKDITDGTSNTILLVEADPDRAVEWTRPEDLPIDLDNPSRGLSRHEKGFIVALADGAVRVIRKGVTKQTLRAAFTRAGGEVLGSDW